MLALALSRVVPATPRSPCTFRSRGLLCTRPTLCTFLRLALYAYFGGGEGLRSKDTLVVVVCIANNRGKKPLVRLWYITLLLGKVGADALLVVLLCLLLSLLEDELRYVAVEVFVCYAGRDRSTHLST
jgi:hypothetical protein